MSSPNIIANGGNSENLYIKEKLAFKVEEGKTSVNCLMRKSLNNLAYLKWRRSYGEAWEIGRDVFGGGTCKGSGDEGE